MRVSPKPEGPMSDFTPTSADERAEWAKEHYEVLGDEAAYPGECFGCGLDYPCPTARLLADLEHAESSRDFAEERRVSLKHAFDQLGRIAKENKDDAEKAERERDAFRDNGVWLLDQLCDQCLLKLKDAVPNKVRRP